MLRSLVLRSSPPSASSKARALMLAAALVMALGCAPGQSATAASTTPATSARAQAAETYEQAEIVSAVSDLFGITAEAAGQVVERVFRENGGPIGYIRGEEVAAALGVGVRYGEGNLQLKNGQTRKVFWQGPPSGSILAPRFQGIHPRVWPGQW